MIQYTEIITIDPQIRFGKPCIRGMRIAVDDIINWLASGMSEAEILIDYPDLTIDDIQAALAYTEDKAQKILIAS